MNALIETDREEITKGDTTDITVESPSGAGQEITRCPKWQIALWSNYFFVMYGGIGELVPFIRVGTLDNPDRFRPDAHIYMSTKQPWFVLPPDARAFEEYYDTEETRSLDNLQR